MQRCYIFRNNFVQALIVNYLEIEWSNRISENFIIDCYAKLDLLTKAPMIGTASGQYANVRKILITKNIALYDDVKLPFHTFMNSMVSVKKKWLGVLHAQPQYCLFNPIIFVLLSYFIAN
jgi:hypothetical protein